MNSVVLIFENLSLKKNEFTFGDVILTLLFVSAVLGWILATIIGERLRMRHERMRAHLA